MRRSVIALAVLCACAGLAPRAAAQSAGYPVRVVTESDCGKPLPPIPNVTVSFQRTETSGGQMYVPTGPVYSVTTDSAGTGTINLAQGDWQAAVVGSDAPQYLISSTPYPWSGDELSVMVGNLFTLDGPRAVTFLKSGVNVCSASGGAPTSDVSVNISTVQSCTANDPVTPASGIAVEIGNQTVTTDANGNATLNMAAGSYPIFASYTADVQSMSLAFVDLLPQNLRYKPAAESPFTIPLSGANQTLVIRLFNCDANGQRVARARVASITAGSMLVTWSRASGNAFVGMVLRDGDDVIVNGVASITWLAGGTISFQDSRLVTHFVIGPQAPAGTAPRPTVSGISILKGLVNFIIPPGETKVNKFDASSGTVCVAIKGTQWAMSVDDQTQVTKVEVTEGTVDITPVNLSLHEFLLSAGQQVQVSMNGVGSITAYAGPTSSAPNNPAPAPGPAPTNANPPAWLSGGGGGASPAPTPSPTSYSAQPSPAAPPSWLSPTPAQSGSGVVGAWQLTSTCGNWGFPAENPNWHATVNLSETANGALSGSFQNDAINMQLVPAASGFNNDPTPVLNSQQSGNLVTLVFHPAGWDSSLQLTGTLNGSEITGKVHHYGSDDCTFTMVRVGPAGPVVGPAKTTPPPNSTPPSTVPNLAGIWTDRNGAWVYQFTQNGASFHWERNPAESANGTINGSEVFANWGTGSGAGRIVLDSRGAAARIEWTNGEVFVRGAPQPVPSNNSPHNPPSVSANPPAWMSPAPTSVPAQYGSGAAGAWQLTSTCGNWGFLAENPNWHAIVNLSETANGALSGSFQNDAIAMQLVPAASGFNNDPTPMMNSQQSGNVVTLVFHPSGWISTLQLTGTLNGSEITGKVHHYGNDDCTFTMVRVGSAGPAAGPTNSTPPPNTARPPNTTAPSTIPNLAGIWTDRNGAWVYQFTQNGASFHWERNPAESANGTINGSQVFANWGTGSGTGQIDFNAYGEAVRIRWSNGEVFLRGAGPSSEGPPTTPSGVFNLSGVWTDRNGAWVYQFTQNGANFHWERNPPESANGTINGYEVSANWGTGSGTGRIVLDASGVAAQIQWSNGEVFLRQGLR